MFSKTALTALMLFISRCSATPKPVALEPLAKRAACAGNTPSTRSEWCDFSIDTDFWEEVPDTGVTREYWFNIEEMTLSPDGIPRYVQTVNGTIPGPTIYADWGDTIKVHVTNNLDASHNGTSVHWHGFRQNHTVQNDGVVSITQCPTAPGTDTTIYTFRALQYGTTWYHSHYALQAWQGIFGSMVINGPATANYDVDMGPLFLSDWGHQTPDELWHEAQTSGPPTLENGLINGTNVFGEDDDESQTGHRWNTTWTEGTSYRLRLVNGAIDTHFKFSIDNHTLTVISMDLVPIEPFTATHIDIGMGQRYDVVVTADQADVADSFWVRAIPQSACSDNDSSENIRGMIYYGDSTATPTTTGHTFADNCQDMDYDSLVPHVVKDVGASGWNDKEIATVGAIDGGLFRWFLNSTTMVVDWADPSLLQVYNNQTEFEQSEAVLEIEGDQWIYLVVQTALAVAHPIHLHGHDFHVLAQGTGTYSNDVVLNLSNPPRRDTAMLPASGYLVMAFYTDNPGTWLMHCHIGWHTTEGFALQWVERRDEIAALVDYDVMQSTCDAWSEHQFEVQLVQDDSGI